MTARKRYLVEGTSIPIPDPENVSPELPAVLREYQRPLESLWSDGTPIDDQGEELFDALVEHFRLDVLDDNAGWKLASELAYMFLPGFHFDPRGKGGAPAKSKTDRMRIGHFWHELMLRHIVGGREASPKAVFKEHEREIIAFAKQLELPKVLLHGDPASRLKTFRTCRKEYLESIAPTASVVKERFVQAANEKFVFKPASSLARPGKK